MPTCDLCGSDAEELFQLVLEWPEEDPEKYDDPLELDDPGAAEFTACGDCAEPIATNVLTNRAISRKLDHIYAGIGDADETAIEVSR